MGINGEQLWDETFFIPPLPPNFGRGIGRPARARRMEPDEVANKQNKTKGKKPMQIRRQQKTVKCSKCGNDGHNAITCARRQTIESAPMEPTKKLMVRKRKFGIHEGANFCKKEIIHTTKTYYIATFYTVNNRCSGGPEGQLLPNSLRITHLCPTREGPSMFQQLQGAKVGKPPAKLQPGQKFKELSQIISNIPGMSQLKRKK
ncbi:hypothetical protein DH2020_046671 [Rehmannia glutinosa]|uniref:CCHC-type domain-containing protein n=1 Tax=Rehmannia glutinosa TaxID=99300 RepID=A0ABR0UAL0_REHGL